MQKFRYSETMTNEEYFQLPEVQKAVVPYVEEYVQAIRDGAKPELCNHLDEGWDMCFGDAGALNIEGHPYVVNEILAVVASEYQQLAALHSASNSSG